MIVSQGTYDGASVMSRCCFGVQQRIRELNPHAIYIHCHAHCLNLVLVDCVKSNSAACTLKLFQSEDTGRKYLNTSRMLQIFIMLTWKNHTEQIGHGDDHKEWMTSSESSTGQRQPLNSQFALKFTIL